MSPHLFDAFKRPVCGTSPLRSTSDLLAERSLRMADVLGLT